MDKKCPSLSNITRFMGFVKSSIENTLHNYETKISLSVKNCPLKQPFGLDKQFSTCYNNNTQRRTHEKHF